MPQLFAFRVEPDEGDPFTVDVTMRTIVAWEKKFPGRALNQVTGSQGVTARDMYELSYVGAKKDGHDLPAFDKFCDTNEIASVAYHELIEATQNTDPTQQAQ